MTDQNDERNARIARFAKDVSKGNDADVVLLNAVLDGDIDYEFIDYVRTRKQHQNLLLILVTNGGDLDVAYRIARFAQSEYKKFTVFVNGRCKSAGTLCILGAHEIVMSACGELGPLDVQFQKKDSPMLGSGLVIDWTFDRLEKNALAFFRRQMMGIIRASRGAINWNLATEIAAKMTIGVFEPIYRQIDPDMLGEIARSMMIAGNYGQRLLIESENCDEDTLRMLINNYPSHGFVIDIKEARNMFENVRKPYDNEERLVRELGNDSRIPDPNDRAKLLFFLSHEQPTVTDNATEPIHESETPMP
jgi:hypothetical protein